MSKRIVFVSLLLLVNNLFYGQIVTVDYDSEEFQVLMKSELNIILTGNEDFDSLLKAAVNKYWDVTEFKFVTSKDVLYSIKDKTNAFMLPMKLQEVKQTSNGPEKSQNHKYWMSIIVGGKKRLSKYTDNDIFVLSPFNFWSGEKKIEDASYRIDYIIKGMNDGISIVRDKKINDSYLKRINAVIDEINTNSNQIKDKTLIINNDAAFIKKMNPYSKTLLYKEIFNANDFKKSYPYKYRFVDNAEYREILQGNSDEHLLLLMVIEKNTHILIYDPSTRKTVYYGFEMQGTKFKKGDIKELLKSAK